MDDVTVICSIVIKDPALLCEKKKKTTTTTSAFTAPRHDDVKPAMNQEPKKKKLDWYLFARCCVSA